MDQLEAVIEPFYPKAAMEEGLIRLIYHVPYSLHATIDYNMSDIQR